MRSQILLCTICLVVVLLLAVTGCVFIAPVPTSTPTPLPPLPTPVPPTTTPTPTPPQPMIVTLKLWVPEELNPYGDGPGADELEEHLASFNRDHADLQVEVAVKKVHGRGGILDYLRTAPEAAPSILPDLVIVSTAELEALATAGHIHPLDDLLPAEGTERFPFAVEMGLVNDQTVGYVLGADIQHLVYRPAQFREPPVAWSQVITPPVSFIFPTGVGDQYVNDSTLIQYMAAGGRVTDLDGKPSLDEQVLVETFTFYSDCIGTGAISPSIVLSTEHVDHSWQRFKEGVGDIAVVQGSSYWREMSGDESAGTAIASIPTRDGYPFTIARNAWAIAMVTEDAGRQAQVMTLFNWLIAPERNAQWTRAAGYLPSTPAALRLWDVAEGDRIALQGLGEAAVPAPSPEVMDVIEPVMREAVESVLTGKASPEEAAAAAVESLGE
jgi:ABC-type glycerol-3-phosphate transport system substrate-binding protein